MNLPNRHIQNLLDCLTRSRLSLLSIGCPGQTNATLCYNNQAMWNS